MKACPLKERFEEKVTPEPNTGCWLWTACGTTDGYGQIKVGKDMVRAHRVAWTLYRGAIPDGMHILHRCDTPPCVNPDHLYLGTHQQNMKDRSSRGRHWCLKKTHCLRGHRFSKENTYRAKNGSRHCRICIRFNAARRRQQKRIAKVQGKEPTQ